MSYVDPSSEGRRHDILVAVGAYSDPQIDDLRCCENDMSTLTKTLATIPSVWGSPAKSTLVSTAARDGSCSKTHLLTTLETALGDVASDDMVLLALSCHGVTVDGRNYLIPADASPDQPDTWIPFQWVKRLLDDTECQFKVILVDACHSGDLPIAFKRAGFRIGFQEPTDVDDLLRSSRGVAYAAACGRDQLAYVRRDGERSVWLDAVTARLDELRASPNGEPILVEDLLPEAALQTTDYVKGQLGKRQTPYYAIRCEGVLPLGVATGDGKSAREKPANPEDLARTTLQAFEARFQEVFGNSMPVEFDRDASKALASEGHPLSRVVHVGPAGHRVRLAVMFDTMLSHEVSLDQLHDLHQLAGRHAIDRLILPREVWSIEFKRPAADLRNLHLIDLGDSAITRQRLFKEFFVAPDRPDAEVMCANQYADVLLTDFGRLFHIVLADLAAPTYDEEYGFSAFGTQRAMAFEEEQLASTLARMADTDLAIDLGCGTGRHTLQLARHVRRVIGYDFSRGMIEAANAKRRELLHNGGSEEASRVQFEVRDVERDPPDFAPNSVDLILGCFGMGSFLTDPVPFLVGLKEQLSPGGRLILSFYNADALVYQAPPPWRDTSLSASLVLGRDELEVVLPQGDTFRIFCRPYPFDLLKSQLARIFDSVQVWSCPAFASFLPSDFFSRGPHSEVARKVIAEVDYDLARRTGNQIGAYFTVVCAKAAEPEVSGVAGRTEILAARGEDALLGLLTASDTPFEMRKHGRVRNVDDVRRELGADGSQLVKAILAIAKATAKEPERHVVLVVQGSRRVDVEKVSTLLGRTPRQWRFATQKEVKSVYGLEIGGVPPFGYADDVPVYVDARLAKEGSVFCGIGNPLQSVRLTTNDLIRISGAEVRDIAVS
jgi:prolyl-tRNA editing enzyme YbaK/EbsC (Cys-tRNA(Pro) deacylase)/SAM-dependent methyltransferase